MRGVYALCRQRVTLYHRYQEAGAWRVARRVLDGCFLEAYRAWTLAPHGLDAKDSFLCLLPARCGEYGYVPPGDFDPETPCFTLARGDKLVTGDGPVAESIEDFAALTAERMPGLYVLGAVEEQYGPDGTLWHVEGRP